MTRRVPKSVNQRRAAWLCLVGAISGSVGCQTSLLHRKDDPGMRELMVRPQPWDADTRSPEPGEQSPSDRISGNQRYGANDRYGDTYGGRPNPYSSVALARNDRSSGNAKDSPRWDELPDEDAPVAQWAPFLKDLPPALWPLAKRQFYAAKQASNSQEGRSKVRAEIDDRDEADRLSSDSDVAEKDSAGSRAAVYRLNDRDDSQDDDARDDVAARPERKSTPAPANDSKRKSPGPASQPAHYTLRDDDQAEGSSDQQEEQELYADTGLEETPLPPVKSRRQADELKPPTARKSSRQVAHAEPIDTGAGDDVRVLPARDGQPGATKSATMANQTAASQTSRQRRSHGSLPETEESDATSVVPASGSRPIQQRPVDVPKSEEPSTKSNATGTNSTKSNKLSSQDHLHEALRQMDEEWSENLTPSEQLHHQAIKRLVQLACGHLEGALEPIEVVPSNEQEFFRHTLQAWHHAIDPTGNPVLARRWPLVLNSGRDGLSHLAAASPLEVKNLGFCSNVDGFGAITKFPTTQFRAGQELLLYCEIDNFVSEQVKDGFETKLQGNYEIVDSSNVKVADQLLPQDTEVCKRARRDYFLVYRIYIPTKLQPGRYQLRLTIEDMKGKKFGQSNIDFQVGT